MSSNLSFIPADVVHFNFWQGPSQDDNSWCWFALQGDPYLLMNDSSIHLYVYCVVNLLILKDQCPFPK